jgi:hypothetical protein
LSLSFFSSAGEFRPFFRSPVPLAPAARDMIILKLECENTEEEDSNLSENKLESSQANGSRLRFQNCLFLIETKTSCSKRKAHMKRGMGEGRGPTWISYLFTQI